MTETEKVAYHRGRQREVLGYIFDKPEGKHVTINELEKHFKGRYSRNQLMVTMNQVCTRAHLRYGIPVERITQGVWKVIDKSSPNDQLPLDLTPQVEKVEEASDVREAITVEIIKERANYLIVEDVFEGKIYKMTLVD